MPHQDKLREEFEKLRQERNKRGDAISVNETVDFFLARTIPKDEVREVIERMKMKEVDVSKIQAIEPYQQKMIGQMLDTTRAHNAALSDLATRLGVGK